MKKGQCVDFSVNHKSQEVVGKETPYMENQIILYAKI